MKPTAKPRPRKRPYGTGVVSVVWSANGWRFKARFPMPGGKYKTLGTYASENEAHAVLNAAGDAQSKPGEMTGAQVSYAYGEAWIETLRDRNKGTWRSTWKCTVKRASWAQYPLDAVTDADIKTWVTTELPATVSEQTGELIGWETQKHAFSLAKRMFAHALWPDKLIATNPSAFVKMGKRPSRKLTLESKNATIKNLPILEVHHLKMLFEFEGLPEKQRSAFAFAIMAGPRQGEQCALDWPDLDLWSAAPSAVVTESWDTDTKTSTPRVISLVPVLVQFLLRWWEHQGRPKTGPVWPSDRTGERHVRGYDFGWAHHPGKRGGKRSDGALREVKLTRLGWWHRAGIRKRVCWHELRHTCGSHMAMGTFGRRWTSLEIRDLLGHTTTEVTDRYVHLAEQALHKAAAETHLGPTVARKSDAPICPTSVRASSADSRNDLQVVDFIRRAAGDSNPRHSAPEAEEITVISNTCDATDRSWTDSLFDAARALLERIGRGESIGREQAQAFAALVLTSRPARLAGALVEASDDRMHGALLELLACFTERPEVVYIGADRLAGGD
jgi:integrase